MYLKRFLVKERTFCLLFLGLLLSKGAFGQGGTSLPQVPTGPRADSLHIWSGTAVGVNQLVLGNVAKVYRKMPWGEGKSLLTTDSHWRLGATTTLAPTFFRPALLIGVSPLLILDIDLHYGPGFNAFQYTFTDFDQPYGWSDRAKMSSSLGVFHQATLNVQLKAAVWKLALLEMADLEYFHSDVYYFNWEIGTILKSGFFSRTKTFLLFEVHPGWRVFANYERFRYYANTWRSQLVSTGVYLSGVLPTGATLLAQLGYHVENPSFTGIKFWAAAYWDWDFPARWRPRLTTLRPGRRPRDPDSRSLQASR